MTAYLNTTSLVEADRIRFGHAWITDDGGLRASVDLGDSHITLHQVSEADALIKAATDAREALLRLAAETPENGTAAGAAEEGTES